MSGTLLGVYVFGSVARGECDTRSDLDLLAIVADGHGKVTEDLVLRHVPRAFRDIEASISWYGSKRLGEMFCNGELFAWHLYQEAKPLFEREHVIAKLGEPAPYVGARDDVASFDRLLAATPHQLAASPQNAVYELGLIYVCLRNICMAASAVVCARPDFSRNSPFVLDGIPPAPLSREEYETAMACRMAGQRGITPPLDVTPAKVEAIYARLSPWITTLRRRLEIEYEFVAKANAI